MSAEAIAGAAAAVGSAVYSGIQTGKMNKRAERFSREMYAKQRSDALTDWDKQNAYNDPSSQMARLKDAGLNPNLVYGNGQNAAGEASQPRASSSSMPNYKVPEYDIGGVALNALQMRQIQSNISRTDAETDAINTRSVGEDFKNQLNTAIGLEAMVNRYSDQSQVTELQREKMNAEWETQKSVGYDGKHFGDKNTPYAKAVKAGLEQSIQDLRNAKVQEDVGRATAVVKQFEANLSKQGIAPNSPWYLKSITTLLNKAGININ